MMTDVRPELQEDSLATRASLLARLKDSDDPASWQEFYDRYRGLIFRFALKAGCTETEADEVVQETVIGVARKLPEFRYQPERCAFKTWLLNLTLWRVKDQLRKRQAWEGRLAAGSPAGTGKPRAPARDDTARTATIERQPDATVERLEAVWNEDWQRTVLGMALARVKAEANPEDCQMFELHVLRGLSPREVARTLGVSTARVYLAKHRIGPRVREQIAELERAGRGGT
jgi:RNA polymerase sigma-70 factor (ECF subfamily)